MEIPCALIAAFPPSANALLDRARQDIDDKMLMEIAEADSGTNAHAQLAALRPIRDQGIIPVPLAWHPGEVLELIRSSRPDVPACRPGGTGRRGHQMRAFARAALLRAGAEPGNEDYDSASIAERSLGHCLVSAKLLGEEMSEAAARFLTWRIPRMEDNCCSDRLLFFVGLLVLAARLRSGRSPDSVLGTVAEWVLAEESHCRQIFAAGVQDNARHVLYSLRSDGWQPLAVELTDEAAAIGVEPLRTNLQLCALLLDQ